MCVCAQRGDGWGVWGECVCVNGGEAMYVCRMCVRACVGERESVCVCMCVYGGEMCVCRMCVGVCGGTIYMCPRQGNVWVCVERTCVYVWWGNDVCL